MVKHIKRGYSAFAEKSSGILCPTQIQAGADSKIPLSFLAHLCDIFSSLTPPFSCFSILENT